MFAATDKLISCVTKVKTIQFLLVSVEQHEMVQPCLAHDSAPEW